MWNKILDWNLIIWLILILYEYPWRYIHLYHVYRKCNLINFPRYSGAKMKQRSNLTGRSDSSLGAMRRSGSFSFAHFLSKLCEFDVEPWCFIGRRVSDTGYPRRYRHDRRAESQCRFRHSGCSLYAFKPVFRTVWKSWIESRENLFSVFQSGLIQTGCTTTDDG